MVNAIKITTYFDNSKSPRILANKIAKTRFVLRSFNSPLKQSAKRLSEEIERQFVVGGDPKWAKLAPATNIRKSKSSRRILIRTGKLRRRAIQGTAWKIDKEAAKYVLPADVGYGNLHLTGFKHHASKVPARSFVQFDSEQENAVKKEFGSWFQERMLRINK